MTKHIDKVDSIAAAVVAAMNAHVGTVKVAEQGCLAIAGLASSRNRRENIFTLSMQEAFVRAGAPRAIVAAMRRHVDIVRVSLQGLTALAAVTALPGAREATINDGALAAIVAVLNAHIDAADVIKTGCRVLTSFAEIPGGLVAAVDAGAPAAITAIMNAHSEVAGIIVPSCAALACMSRHPVGRQAAIAAGAPAAIFAAVARHAAARPKGEAALALLA